MPKYRYIGEENIYCKTGDIRYSDFKPIHPHPDMWELVEENKQESEINKKEEQDCIYKMKLHDVIRLNELLEIIKVHGGWIYNFGEYAIFVSET